MTESGETARTCASRGAEGANDINSQAKGLIIGQFPGERMRTDEDQSFR